MPKNGLMVAEEANKHVTSVRCSFCALCIRTNVKAGDEHAGEKRKRNSCKDTKYWTKFVPQNYRSRHESQRTDLWTEYTALYKEENSVYFDGKANRANSLHRRFDFTPDLPAFRVSAPIVDVIIADLFFRPNKVLDDER
uniref:Uncharacterized protein n=1 Tax=Peronospora matthiolae TaxID=2874970 RepID=A0AAV1UGB6_9STRA